MLSLKPLGRKDKIVDKVNPERRSENMRRIRSKDTGPEMAVRRLVYKLGYRYRLHRKDLPGKPDMTFTGRRKVIFVNGCFWHQHPGCEINHLPKTNHKYWVAKLERNVQRDKKAIEKLSIEGWDVLVIWECEVKDQEHLQKKIESFLSAD